MTTFILTLLGLLAAHYVADFAMQNDFVAAMKAKVHTDPHGIHALAAHAIHHGVAASLALFLLGASPEATIMVGAVTAATHAVIDYLKAVENAFGIHVDQALHLGVIVLLAVGMGVDSV